MLKIDWNALVPRSIDKWYFDSFCCLAVWRGFVKIAKSIDHSRRIRLIQEQFKCIDVKTIDQCSSIDFEFISCVVAFYLMAKHGRLNQFA